MVSRGGVPILRVNMVIRAIHFLAAIMDEYLVEKRSFT